MPLLHASRLLRTRSIAACAVAAWAAALACAQAADAVGQSPNSSLIGSARKPVDVALIRAVKHGDPAAVRLLLDRGADPNTREVRVTLPSLKEHTEGGKPELADTTLMIASSDGNLPIVQLLLDRSADPNAPGMAGFTPLMEAASMGRTAVVRLLLDHGARVDQPNEYGDTALTLAAHYGHTDVMDLLLQRGADINGGTGPTPLYEAAYCGQVAAVKLLLSRGADPNYRWGGGATALEGAEAQGIEEVATLIRKAGGKRRPGEERRKDAATYQAELAAERRKDEAEARKWRGKATLTAEDRQVLTAALRDMLANGRRALRFDRQRGTEIVLARKSDAVIGPWLDDRLNDDLRPDQALELSLDMRASLVRRNQGAVSLRPLRLASRHVRLGSDDEVRGLDRFWRRPYAPDRAWVKFFLPGYSKRRDRAVVRFWFGPTAHGAAGTYLLVRQHGAWHVRWRRYAYYA